MFKKKRSDINNVFTPRNPDVNKKMYIHRESLEKDLLRKVNGYKHIIIYGESGCGKSWLFSKVLSEKKIDYSFINLAHVTRFGSITNVFENQLAEEKEYEKVNYSDTTKAEANAVIAKGNLEHQSTYKKMRVDPLREYLKVNKNKKIIVLDNLETIFKNQKYMEELGNILTLLDDSQYKVKFIIVGVPAGVIQYFGNTVLLKTVANRLTELSEVRGLEQEQVREFVKKGFIDELLVNISDDDLDDLSNHIYWVTNGIPQKIHEYCETLAYLIEDNKWEYVSDYKEIADKKWVKDSLHKNYLLISQMMNSNNTNVGRRNQVLYCLGKIGKNAFKVAEIEKILRREFHITTVGKNLSLNLTLNEIVDWANSFIKKNGKAYIVTDSDYILCIRMMLIKNEREKIEKLDISQIN